MTQAEDDKIDPDGRAMFSRAVRRDVLPWLEKQREYAGAWLDQKKNGSLVVALTDSRPALVASIDKRMPTGPRGWRLVEAEHTMAELEAAAKKAFDVRGRLSGGSAQTFSEVDVENNRVILQYAPSKVESARSAKAQWSADLGVPVKIETGAAPRDTAICTMGQSPPNNCWKPIPAGVRTRSFSNSSSGRVCTMGFQVYKAGANPPNQWLTAGHCVHPWKPGEVPTGNKKVWHSQYFHDGAPMGKRKATLYDNDKNKDIARVALDFTSERTDKIWKWGGATVGPHLGILANDFVHWVGVGSNGKKSGNIKSDSTCWGSEAWGNNHNNNPLTVCGARVENTKSIDGDSGGPVFTKVPVYGRSYLTPVGIVSGNKPDDGPDASMVFTKLTAAFNQWSGWEIRYTGCC